MERYIGELERDKTAEIPSLTLPSSRRLFAPFCTSSLWFRDGGYLFSRDGADNDRPTQ